MTSKTTTPNPISSAVEIPPEPLVVVGFGTVNGAVCVGVVVGVVVWLDCGESPGSVVDAPLVPVEDAALAEGASASAIATGTATVSLIRIAAI
jgi:hypothetical protein